LQLRTIPLTVVHEFSYINRLADRCRDRFLPVESRTPVLAMNRIHPTSRSLPPSDPAHFRQCLSRFATGVTVVATRGDDGRFVGLTANSFNSLSLDPPLILWSLGTKAASVDAFKGQRYFSVSVLAFDQIAVARRFATRLVDRFQGVDVHEGLDGIPLIGGAVAWFECERRTQYLHGDHWLFIGEVKRCAMSDGSPLIFRHGEFAVAEAIDAEPTPLQAAPPALEPGDQPFYEEYLPYLLARAGHQVALGFHRQLRLHGLNMLSWRVLAALSTRDDWTIGDLCAVCLAKQPTVSKLVDRLLQQRLVSRRDDPTDARRVLVSLTSTGRDRIAPVLQDAAAFNLSLLGRYPTDALTGMKTLLRDMIGRYPDGDGGA
jgi:flavin reductase (DIM6/NTAB) family NADH-FMN oxidoreductase RutF/DNA-binding MarR family transcriptional regulator